MGLRREKSSDYLKNHEEERALEIFDLWNKVAQKERFNKIERYENKIDLQKKLIMAHDKLSEDTKLEKEAIKIQLRKLKRQEKNDFEDSLKAICRQSLDEDKQQKKINYRKYHKIRNQLISELNQTNNSNVKCDVKVKVISTSKNTEEILPKSTKSQDTINAASSLEEFSLEKSEKEFANNLKPLIRTKTAITEEDDAEIEETECSDPWYVQQMYELFGNKDAEYFLYPKFTQKVNKPVNSKLHKVGGHAGVKSLWATLRNESKRKLINQDKKISKELKQAHNAFVREGIDKKLPSIKRSFYDEEDIPEMDHLVDESKLAQSNLRKYRTGLMYRASTMNDDKSRVLLYNKNMNEYAKNSDDESSDNGVGRFIPISYDDEPADSEKWICKTEIETKLPTLKGDIDLLVRMAEKDKNFVKNSGIHLPHLKFLADEDSRVEGKFSKRCQSLVTNKEKNSENSNRHYSPNKIASDENAFATDDKTVTSKDKKNNGYEITSWPPLSMNAITEYSRVKEAAGKGQFTQGSQKYWVLKSAVASA